MESLDTFRHFWQQEISKEKSNQSNSSNNISNTASADLSQLGTKSKHSLECQTPVPLLSQSIRPTHSVGNNASFTIGIGTFTTSNIKPSSIEPPTKKLKTANVTLIDELIRDIDESTDIPFFNMSLPREIALQIFDYLSIKDLYSCLQVCKSWHSLSCDELLWYNLYKRLKFDNKNKIFSDNNWKNHVKEAILSNENLVQNFKNHQCRTTKLTNRLGIVLTCANNDRTTIIAGYSTGIIRTWSIDSILNADENDEDNEPLNTPDIIYESTHTNQDSDLSSVKAVGLLKNDIYAVHDNGLLEIWTKDKGDQPRYTKKLTSLPIEHVTNDENILCTASRSRFYVWSFNETESSPQFQELNFISDINDRILSYSISSHHSVPISIIAGNKSLWCVSLTNLSNRLSFYSTLQTDYREKIPLDIHNEEPLAIIGSDNEIKLFDLQSGRCNIISTNYKYLPSGVHLIRANSCPINEFIVAYDNSQISIFDRRQKEGAIQHFYNHYSTITTLQMDNWKLASTDVCGFVRLWDRRMQPHSLWHMNPQSHPVTHCSFDKQTLICALTPYCKQPDTIEYQIHPDLLSGHIYVCNFNSDVSTQLDDDLKICTSSYDAPKASNRRIGLHTPYDIIS